MTLDENQLLLLGFVLLFSLAAVFAFKVAASRRRQSQLRPCPSLTIDPKDPRSGWTVRVRGVPLHWDAERLTTFLAESSGAVVNIKSLAQEIQEDVKSATASFEVASSGLHTPRISRSIQLPTSPKEEASRPAYIRVDDDFHGITTLFIPPDADHRIDVIALSGLGGHAFGSFKQRAGEYMWLRDALPYDLVSDATGRPIVRVMTFGLLPRAAGPTVRPIIFVAHSLGGLIVKQVLISLSKSKNKEDQKLLRAVYGIVFFGVPHDSMDIASLIPMIVDGPNRFLVESLSYINSQVLSAQQREFELALGGQGGSEVVCFYETEESPTAQQVLKYELGYNRGIGIAQARVSLHGLEGVGKTQIALAYVYQLRKMRPDVSVFWVYASNVARFRQSLGIIAQQCQIPGYEDPKNNVPSLVKAWLESQDRGQWIMVLDNADDLKLFYKQPHDTTGADNKEGSLQ
ncbi:Protein SERAC1 [Paramyrothecium foliicola]|nr:Protein SERAC1 [Paramyrothecium foliicola]